MRIGILTLPLHRNYGGILQAYALQTVLEHMGHKVFVIEKKVSPLKLPILKMPLSYGKRIIKNIFGDHFPIFYEKKYNRNLLLSSILCKNTILFIDKYIHRIIFDDFLDIDENDFDAIIVGSDQIWRPKYFQPISHAYLDFTKDWNIKRVAYAASFGTDSWEYTQQQTDLCRELLSFFDAVSVREISGVDLCRNYYGIRAELVLDPTMLLSKDDYIKLFKDSTPKSDGNLLVYILDETPEKDNIVKIISDVKKLIPFRVNSKVEDESAKISERIQPPLEQWLRGFYDAEFIITDSFHACVFAILFNKPFIAIGNAERGLSRFISLFSIFGLNDRLVTNISQLDKLNEIDWFNVNQVLVKKKKFAYSFLINNLVAL